MSSAPEDSKRKLLKHQSSGSEYHQKEMYSTENLHSMLEAQLDCVLPLELPALKRHRDHLLSHFKATELRILDIGCGTGGFLARIATQVFPEAETLHGVDVVEENILFANSRFSAKNLAFSLGDAFDLHELPSASFHLVTCRHMIHCVTEPHSVLREIRRLLVPNGVAHISAEDYGMCFGYPNQEAIARLFVDLAVNFFNKAGCDGAIGRKIPAFLLSPANALSPSEASPPKSFVNVKVEYMNLDTIHDRAGLLSIFSTWRRNYAKALADSFSLPESEIQALWTKAIESASTGYFTWLIPLISAQAQ